VSVRGTIAAAAVACGVAAGVAGAAWAVQVGFLVAPPHEDVVAAETLGWLRTDSLVESTFAFRGGPLRQSRCIGTWQPLSGGRSELAAVLALDGMRRIIPVGRPFVTARGGHAKPSGRLLARLRLAGCPPVLASLLGGAIRHPSAPYISHTRIDGRSALALRAWTKGGHVTLYVADTNGRPLAVAVVGPGVSGRARLQVARLSPSERRRLLEAGP
jgi:hypothetical protein